MDKLSSNKVRNRSLSVALVQATVVTQQKIPSQCCTLGKACLLSCQIQALNSCQGVKSREQRNAHLASEMTER